MPHGLVVYISPQTDPGGYRQLFQVYTEKQVIWIGAFRSGNYEAKAPRRIRLALEARKYALLNYNIDPKRIYLSGASGDGVACSTLVSQYPYAFTGSIQIIGASGFERVSNRQKIRGIAPNISTRHNTVNDREIDKIRRNHRFVIIAGRQDWGYYKVMKNAYTSMRKLRFDALFIELPDHGHELRVTWPIVQGIDYLDAPRDE